MHDHAIRSTRQRKALSSAVCLLDSKLAEHAVSAAVPDAAAGAGWRQGIDLGRLCRGRCHLLPARRGARYTRPPRMRLTLIRLELLASTLLLGVAFAWSALRGLDLVGAIRPALGPTALGAAAG